MSAKKISKPIKSLKQEKPTFISTFSLSNYIPEKYHILVFAIVILALFLFFFSPYGHEEETLRKLEAEMKGAAKRLEFEYAAKIRDRIKELKQKMIEIGIRETSKQ